MSVVRVLRTVGAALGRLTAELVGKLRPSFDLAVVGGKGAPREHRVDMGTGSVHSTTFEARLNHPCVGTFDGVISDGPASGLKGWIVQWGFALGPGGEGLCEFNMVGLCGGELACSR